MNKDIINSNNISELLKTEQIDKSNINLYETYLFLLKYCELENKNQDISLKKLMNSLENKIYTVGNRTLTDKERILFELNKIEKKLKDDTIKTDNKEYWLSQIQSLKNFIYPTNSKIEEIDISIINYLKKEITKIQSALGLKNTFFNALNELFEDNINLKIYHQNLNKIVKKKKN